MANYYKRRSVAPVNQYATGPFAASSSVEELGRDIGERFAESGENQLKVALELRKERKQTEREEARLNQRREENASRLPKFPIPDSDDASVMKTGGMSLLAYPELGYSQKAAFKKAEILAERYGWEKVELEGATPKLDAKGNQIGVNPPRVEFVPPKGYSSKANAQFSEPEEEDTNA